MAVTSLPGLAGTEVAASPGLPDVSGILTRLKEPLRLPARVWVALPVGGLGMSPHRRPESHSLQVRLPLLYKQSHEASSKAQEDI